MENNADNTQYFKELREKQIKYLTDNKLHYKLYKNKLLVKSDIYIKNYNLDFNLFENGNFSYVNIFVSEEYNNVNFFRNSNISYLVIKLDNPIDSYFKNAKKINSLELKIDDRKINKILENKDFLNGLIVSSVFKVDFNILNRMNLIGSYFNHVQHEVYGYESTKLKDVIVSDKIKANTLRLYTITYKFKNIKKGFNKKDKIYFNEKTNQLIKYDNFRTYQYGEKHKLKTYQFILADKLYLLFDNLLFNSDNIKFSDILSRITKSQSKQI